MMGRYITTFDPPPIPLRQFDWKATRDGYEPGDPIGYGKTEEQSLRELQEQEEMDNA